MIWHKLSSHTYMERMLTSYLRPIRKPRADAVVAPNRGELRLVAPSRAKIKQKGVAKPLRNSKKPALRPES